MIPLPASWFGLGFLIALVIPGLVYTAVKAALAGSRDVDSSTLARVLQAVVISATFDALWALLLLPLVPINPLINPRAAILDHPRAAAALFLGCGVLAPAIIAWLIHGQVQFLSPVWDRIGRLWLKVTGSAYASTPTAWDYALELQGETWVRVRLSEGRWVGGSWDEESYASTFPRPRDLFIRHQWEIDQRGVFQRPIEKGRGLWVAVTDDCIVEFLENRPTTHTDADPEPHNTSPSADRAGNTDDPHEEETA